MPELTVKVEVAWASNPLSDPAAATWTDISDHVLSVSGASGRTSEQGQVPAGTCEVQLLDIDGDYDPSYSGGANWPNVTPGKLVRVRVSDYADRILSHWPLAYWRLGEQSGTTMVDSSGNGNDGTYLNTPTFGVSGPLVLESATAVGLARASSEYGYTAYKSGLNPANLTVTAWVYRTSSATFRYIAVAETANRGYRLGLNSSHQIEWRTGNGTSTAAVMGPVVPLSTWTHIAATTTASAQQIYVDGVLEATGANVYTPNLAAQTEIGAHGGGNTWDGRVAEVALFNNVLPAATMRHLYEMGSGLTTLFTGAVDDWQQSYAHGLGPATVTVSATDATETLEAASAPLDHEQVVRRLKPARYFRFGDVAAGRLIDEGSSPQNGVVQISTALQQDATLGQAAVVNSNGSNWPLIFPATNVGTSDFTLSCWAKSDPATYSAYLYLASQDAGTHLMLHHWLDEVRGGSSSRYVTARIVRYPASRDWIHYCVVRSSSGGTETVRLYINGAEAGTAATGATVNVTATSTMVGSIAGSKMNLAHWALWSSALTATQVDMLWQSGLPGWQAQRPQARIQTALTLAGWTAPTVLDSGSSRCAAARGGSALSVCAEAAEADEGMFIIDGRGRPTFHSRASRRRLGSAPEIGFGDTLVGVFEQPYSDVTINNDSDKLWTTATINGRYAEDATAAASYGRRAPSGSGSRSVLTGRDAQARAEGIVAAHKTPATRIDQITWDLPVRGGVLALQLEVNDWIRVTRRPRAGQTITKDLFVERRQWQIDTANGTGNAGAGKITCALSATEPGQNTMLTFGTSTYAASDTVAS